MSDEEYTPSEPGTVLVYDAVPLKWPSSLDAVPKHFAGWYRARSATDGRRCHGPCKARMPLLNRPAERMQQKLTLSDDFPGALFPAGPSAWDVVDRRARGAAGEGLRAREQDRRPDH